jgi:heme A synthase
MQALHSSRWLQRLALCCLALMLVVVASSAWLRLAQPRPTCIDWPDCRAANALPATPVSAGSPALEHAARGVHRLAASLLLPAAGALAWLGWRASPLLRVPVALLLALALALAGLGVVTPGSRALAVLLGNQLGGWLMLALAWRLVRRSAKRAAPAAAPAANPTWLRRTLALTLMLWLLQAALGALSGAGLHPALALWHLFVASLVLPLAALCGLWTRHGPRALEGRALLLLLVLQALLGVLAVTGHADAARVWLHAMCGAVGLAALFALLDRAGTMSQT